MDPKSRRSQQNHAQAACLHKATARQGASCGQRNLAMMYREGLGVPSDAVTADGWIALAASVGIPTHTPMRPMNAMPGPNACRRTTLAMD